MKVDQQNLKRLEVLLREAVHAPGCNTIKRCPNQCFCKHDRKFQLNTETAICWQIADNINIFLTHKEFTKKSCEALKIKSIAYEDIARFHMSKGWERFFCLITRTIEYLTELEIWNPWESTESGLEYLRQMIGRLKRYPRN
jgi:hypothetical protein